MAPSPKKISAEGLQMDSSRELKCRPLFSTAREPKQHLHGGPDSIALLFGVTPTTRKSLSKLTLENSLAVFSGLHRSGFESRVKPKSSGAAVSVSSPPAGTARHRQLDKRAELLEAGPGGR